MPRREIWTRTTTTQTPDPELGRAENRIATALAERSFFWTIEFVVSAKHKPSDDKIVLDEFVRELSARPEIVGFSVTDRVTSNEDPSPIGIAAEIAARTGMQPIVHWSGKDRSLEDLEDSIVEIEENGLENILFLTGDKLHGPPSANRVRYLESVNSLHYAKGRMKSLVAAAALNPFKYREEEAMAQYLKVSKKIAVGADLIITQIGFDPNKHEEALFWMHANDNRIPIVANLMALSAPRARFIRKHNLAGVVITDELAALLESDYTTLSKDVYEARVMRRLALQIQKLFHSGYSGIQITGLHSVNKLLQLQAAVDKVEAEVNDRLTWDDAWAEVMTFPTGHKNGAAQVIPDGPWYMTQRGQDSKPSRKDMWKHSFMRRVHSSVFEQGLPAKLLRATIGVVSRGSKTDNALAKIERMTKGPLVGCETCGNCRLAMTQYICPETCPKGLANGPCGGTDLNRCEFGDRECIHSQRYRLARERGELEEMSKLVIAAVPEATRGTSSWPPYLRGERPKVAGDKNTP